MSEVKRVKKMVMVEVTHSIQAGDLDWYDMDEEVIASLYQVDHAYILAWDSYINNKKTTWTIKAQPGIVTLVGVGNVHSRQTFRLHDWNPCQYFYNGNSLMVRNYCNRLEYVMKPDGGLIDIWYEQWMGEHKLGEHLLELFIR